jgi:alpha-mannosidase
LFTDGHYTGFNLTSALDRGRLDDESHVRMTLWSAPGMEKPTFAEGVAALRSDSVRIYRKGDWLGPSWTNHWVHVVLNIPENFRKSGEPVICKAPFENTAEEQSNLIQAARD